MNFRESVYWSIYGDIWNFHKKYCEVRTDDDYWQSVVDESNAIYKKYRDEPEGEFCKRLILEIISELERIYRREKE